MTAILTTKLDDINVKDEFEKIAQQAEKAGLSVSQFAKEIDKAGKTDQVLNAPSSRYSDQVKTHLQETRKARDELKRAVAENLRNLGGGTVRDIGDLLQLPKALNQVEGGLGRTAKAGLAVGATFAIIASGISIFRNFSKATRDTGDSSGLLYDNIETLKEALASIKTGPFESAAGHIKNLFSSTQTADGAKRMISDFREIDERIKNAVFAIKDWSAAQAAIEKNKADEGADASFVAGITSRMSKPKGAIEAEEYFKAIEASKKLAKENAKLVADDTRDNQYRSQVERLTIQTGLLQEIQERQEKIVELGKLEEDHAEEIKKLIAETGILIERRNAVETEAKLANQRLAEKIQADANTDAAKNQAFILQEIELRKELLKSNSKLAAQEKERIDALKKKVEELDQQRTDIDAKEADRLARERQEQLDAIRDQIEANRQLAKEKEVADRAEMDRIAEAKRLRDEAAQKELEHLQKIRGLLKGQKEAIQQNQQADQQQAQGGQQNFGPGIAGDQSQRFGPNLANLFDPMKMFFQQQIQTQQARGGVDRDILRAAQRQNRAAFDQDLGFQNLGKEFGRDDRLKNLFLRKEFTDDKGIARKRIDAQIKRRKRQIQADVRKKAGIKLGQANKQARKNILGGKPPAGAVKEVADAKQDKVLGAAKKRGAVNQQQIDLLKKLQALDQAEQAELDKVQVDLTNVKAAIDALTNKQQQRVRKMR